MNIPRLLKQFQEHTGFFKGTNGDTFYGIKIGNNLMDVFPENASGWPVPTRYRLKGGAWVYQHGPKIRGAF